MDNVEREEPDFKNYPLPLARIKKVMKSDEDVKVSQAGFSSRFVACRLRRDNPGVGCVTGRDLGPVTGLFCWRSELTWVIDDLSGRRVG